MMGRSPNTTHSNISTKSLLPLIVVPPGIKHHRLDFWHFHQLYVHRSCTRMVPRLCGRHDRGSIHDLDSKVTFFVAFCIASGGGESIVCDGDPTDDNYIVLFVPRYLQSSQSTYVHCTENKIFYIFSTFDKIFFCVCQIQIHIWF